MNVAPPKRFATAQARAALLFVITRRELTSQLPDLAAVELWLDRAAAGECS